MTEARVTVGIPTFNRAAWLHETLQSVLAQTFTGFRIVVSDNASTDNTRDVVRSLRDERIKYVHSDRNIGAIGNLNRLIALTETEFLLLLPDDDVLYPTHLSSCVELLEQHGSIGLVHSAYNVIAANSRVIRRVEPVATRSPMTVERRDLALERLMMSGAGLCFASVVYRTRAITEAGGFRDELGPFCDRDLWMRIALGWEFGYLAAPLVGQRLHPTTRTSSIAGQNGAASDWSERYLLHSRMHYDRRIEFLEDAQIEPQRTRRLKAMASLRFLVDSAAHGLPSAVVARRLVRLIECYPRIVLRPTLWRLVVAQLGARRVWAAVRASSITRNAVSWVRGSRATA